MASIPDDLDHSHLRQRQLEIARLLLSNRGNKDANSYIGAIRVLSDKHNPDRFAQAAHSIRNINDFFVRKVNLPEASAADQDSNKEEKINHKKKIIKKLSDQDPMGGAPEHIVGAVAARVVELNKWFVGVSHGEVEPDEEMFNRNLGDLEEILLYQNKDYFSAISDLDKLLALSTPTPDDLQRVSYLLTTRKQHEYFFANCAKQWFPVLLDGGYFQSLPERLEGWPNWPESQFLIKVAAEFPSEVVGVIRSHADAQNPRIWEDFIKAAQEMPFLEGQKVARLLLSAKNINLDGYTWLPKLIVDFVRYLVHYGDTVGGLKLVNRLFHLRFEPTRRLPEPFYSDWEYGELIAETRKLFMPVDAAGYLKMLCSKLRLFWVLSKRKSGSASTILRPKIEENRTGSGGIDDILISSIIEILKVSASSSTNDLKTLMGVIGTQGEEVFRRIEYYIYSLYPESFVPEIQQVLLSTVPYKKYDRRRELANLLRLSFPGLPKRHKTKIINIINRGPNTEKLKGTPMGRVNQYIRRWKAIWLEQIQSDLDSARRMAYQKLKKEFGENLAHNEGISSTFVGPDSPISIDELRSKTTSEILEFLRKWVPPPERFGAPSPEGLGRDLEKIVRERPGEFSKVAADFYDNRIRFAYTYHLIWGLHQTLKEPGHEFYWDSIIDLGLSLARSRSLDKFPEAVDSFEPYITSIQKELAHLFHAGFFSKKYPLPFERRRDIFEILKWASESPDPTPDYESKYGGNNMDPASMSINTARGQAMHALVNLAVWQKNQTGQGELSSDIKKILEDHLSPQIDGSVTIRSVYGQELGALIWVDKIWVQKNIENIFSLEPELEKLWLVAFESFVVWNHYNSEFYIHYERAIKSLDKFNDKLGGQFIENLGIQLMLAYMRTEDNVQLLLELFLKFSNSKDHAKSVWYTGVNILDKKDLHSSEVSRLKEVWDMFLGSAHLSNAKSLGNFSFWFINSPFGKPWTIEHLYATLAKTDGVIERAQDVLMKLKDYVADFPELVARCITLIIKPPQNFWHFNFHAEECLVILRAIIATGNPEAKKSVRQIVDFLGRKGLHQFGSLLKEIDE